MPGEAEPIELEVAIDDAAAFLLDLSTVAGCFVPTDAQVGLGSRVAVKVPLTSSAFALRITAVVVGRRAQDEGEGKPAGLILRFANAGVAGPAIARRLLPHVRARRTDLGLSSMREPAVA